LDNKKPAHWKFTDTPCCRCDADSSIDQFEPRGAIIEADRIDASNWLRYRQENHEQYPG
jgi:hypothetical protein